MCDEVTVRVDQYTGADHLVVLQQLHQRTFDATQRRRIRCIKLLARERKRKNRKTNRQ